MGANRFAIRNPFGDRAYQNGYNEGYEYQQEENPWGFEEEAGYARCGNNSKCGNHDNDPCGDHPATDCPPIYEKPTVECVHRYHYFNVHHYQPVHVKYIDHCIYRHYNIPKYTCEEIKVREDVHCYKPYPKGCDC